MTTTRPTNPNPVTMVSVLEEVLRFLDGSYMAHVRVIQREKEQQVADQNFDAAAVLRDEERDLTHYWSRDELRRRVLQALGRLA